MSNNESSRGMDGPTESAPMFYQNDKHERGVSYSKRLHKIMFLDNSLNSESS